MAIYQLALWYAMWEALKVYAIFSIVLLPVTVALLDLVRWMRR